MATPDSEEDVRNQPVEKILVKMPVAENFSGTRLFELRRYLCMGRCGSLDGDLEGSEVAGICVLNADGQRLCVRKERNLLGGGEPCGLQERHLVWADGGCHLNGRCTEYGSCFVVLDYGAVDFGGFAVVGSVDEFERLWVDRVVEDEFAGRVPVEPKASAALEGVGVGVSAK
jgi:hypothetical protein